MDPFPILKTGAEIAGQAMERAHLGKVARGEEELGVRDVKYVYNHLDQWGDGDGDVDLDDVTDIAQDVIGGIADFLGGLLGG